MMNLIFLMGNLRLNFSIDAISPWRPDALKAQILASLLSQIDGVLYTSSVFIFSNGGSVLKILVIFVGNLMDLAVVF